MAKNGGEEEDYFTHFEDLEFTEEDLARLDQICEGELAHESPPKSALPLPESKGGALVMIEVEQGLQPISEAVLPPAPSPHSSVWEPPYDAFRSGKSLSVSDLTGPLWCAYWHESSDSHSSGD
jgi:hypothetical protein